MITLREAAMAVIEQLKHGWVSASDEVALGLCAALEQPEHSPDCALLQIPSRDCDCQPEQEPDWDEIRCGGPGCDLKCCQPVNEPVAVCEYCEKERPVTHPPRREWQGLTDEEIARLCADNFIAYGNYTADFICAIEAKLKEKNNG
jgi:hypothetical protein